MIKTSEHYIVFLDLLAGKEIIYNDPDFKHLNKINNMYSSWFNIKDRGFYFNKLKMKIFSDNIIIAIETEVQNALNCILEFSNDLIEHFLICGYKVRGGISKGQLHLDETFVWGEGLVSAYMLENSCAVYPRVLISNQIYEDLTADQKAIYVLQDKDNRYHFDYLNGIGRSYEKNLERINEWLVSLHTEINDKELDPKVYKKLQWFNHYLTLKKEHFEKELEQKAIISKLHQAT